MQFLAEMLNIKHSGTWTEIEPHGTKYPILKDITKNTYGFILYQEQLMKLVQLLADYSEVEADEFRKMVSKKLVDKLEKEKKRFSAKAITKGMTQDNIDELWEQIKDFGA